MAYITRQGINKSNFSSGLGGNLSIDCSGWRTTVVFTMYDPGNTTGTPTLAGNNMTQVQAWIDGYSVWIYQNPSPGVQTLHWSRGSDTGSPAVLTAVYSGTKSSGGVNVSNTGSGTGATITGSATTTVNNTLGVMLVNSTNGQTASTHSTFWDSISPNVGLYDTTGFGDVPSGSFSMVVTQTSAAYSWIILFLEPFSYSGTSGTEVVTGTSTTFRTAPTATLLTIKAWAGGGSTGTRNTSGGNGGGGGGAFSQKNNLAVTGGTNYTCVINGSGHDTTFNGTDCVAKGGADVADNTNTKGLGGLASGGVGDVKYSGGDGGDGGGSGTNSGGGGGGAGTTGAGGNASGQTHGTGTTLNGGNGADGFTANSAAGGGSDYGGGASGAYRTSGSRSGAGGGNGYMTIDWSAAVVNQTNFFLAKKMARL